METIQKNTAYIILALVGAVSLWFFGFWQFLTGEPLLPFLNKRGWLDMPFSYYAVLIVMGCAILVLQVWAIAAFRQFVKWKEVRWLEKLAKNHTATMDHLVSVVHPDLFRLPVTPYFSDIENQFVVFSIPIVNRSIYTLTLGEIKNQFTFKGELLPDLPHIKSTPGLPKVPKNTTYFIVEIVQKISSPIVERIQSQGEGTFGAHNVSIKFSYRDYTDAPQTVNVNLGGTISFSLTSN